MSVGDFPLGGNCCCSDPECGRYGCKARRVPAILAQPPRLITADWRPISEAPKDGTHILACDAEQSFGWRDGKPLPPVQTVIHWYEFGAESGWYTSVNELAPVRPFPATHWKPLTYLGLAAS